MITKREFLKAGSAALALPFGMGLLLSHAADGVIELRAQAVEMPVTSGSSVASPLWLYNGETPGPEIRVRQGDRVRVRFFNDLKVPTSIHWHGIRIDNAMDGVPGLTQKPVLPGERFDYDFIVPDAGTFWYHAHFDGFQQVARGLYGALIVEESDAVFAPDREITLILDDWWIEQDGSFADGFEDYLQGKQGGRIGNVITINGESLDSSRTVKAGAWHRLRLINAANARIFHLDVSQLAGRLLALDGFAIEPREIDELVLAPAQRADFSFRLEAGQRTSVLDASGTLGKPNDNGGSTTVFCFEGDAAGTNPNNVEPTLRKAILPDPNLDKALRVPLLMQGGSLSSVQKAVYAGAIRTREQLNEEQQVWTFNGIANLPKEPLFSVPVGTSVIIEMQNKTGWQHPMHVHGHHFKVIKGNSSRPSDVWQDTVLVGRMSDLQIAFVADNPGKWLLHCHLLQHAVSGMRTWFEVTT